MCDAGGKKKQAIDAALAKAEAREPRRWRTFLGDRKAITWTPTDDGDWVGDAFDWLIRPMDNGEYAIHHKDEVVYFTTLDWAMGFVEMHRIMEGPPGEA